MNVKKVLEYYKIPFVESHPNQSHKCYGLDCPFCGDKTKHLGIFKDSGTFSCWKCHAKGSFFYLVKQSINDLSISEFNSIAGIRHTEKGAKENLDSIFFDHPYIETKSETLRLDLGGMIPVSQTYNTGRKLINRFLRQRNFTMDTLSTYGCLYALKGVYQGRLIIPIPAFGEMEGFTARDLTGNARQKYLFPKGFKAHNYLYCPDYKSNITIITEGIFDAWAVDIIGFHPTCIFGKSLSQNQLLQLVKKEYLYIYLALDGDARKEQEEIRKQLSSFDANIIECNIPKGQDPASINLGELFNVIQEAIYGDNKSIFNELDSNTGFSKK